MAAITLATSSWRIDLSMRSFAAEVEEIPESGQSRIVEAMAAVDSASCGRPLSPATTRAMNC